VLNRGKKTQKVDVFMLGCCACYTLTGGRHPFDVHVHDSPDAHNPNLFIRSANVLHGYHDLGPLLSEVYPPTCGRQAQVFPAAFELLEAMVDQDAVHRPTVDEALEHPFFWNAAKRHEFLCAYGNTGPVKSGGRKAAELPPGLLPHGRPWTEALPAAMLRSAGQHAWYDGRSVPDLLRFLRNINQHGGDRGMGPAMADAAAEPGGPAAYFQRLFPWLLMPVWHAAILMLQRVPSESPAFAPFSLPRLCPGRSHKQEAALFCSAPGSGGGGYGSPPREPRERDHGNQHSLRPPFNSPSFRTPPRSSSRAAATAAASSAAEKAAAATAATATATAAAAEKAAAAAAKADAAAAVVAAPQTQKPSASPPRLPVLLWLADIGDHMAVYADQLSAYGYEDSNMLKCATDEDLAEAFGELDIKKPHQRAIKNAIATLKEEESAAAAAAAAVVVAAAAAAVVAAAARAAGAGGR
jgi:hypothetical protein